MSPWTHGRLRPWLLLLLGALPLMTPGLARLSGSVGTRLAGFLPPQQHVAARLAHRRPAATWAKRQLVSHQAAGDHVFPTCFEIELPTGHCMGVRLPSEPETAATVLERLQSDPGQASEVHPEEVAMVSHVANHNAQLSFLGGRAALRRLLHKLHNNDDRFKEAMPRDKFGAPVLPDGVFASISHKDDIAVGLVRHGSPDDETTVGVDLERCEPKRVNVAPRILTEAERAQLGRLAHVGVSAESEVLLRFSLKEGLYKAIHPFVRRYVGFLEAEAEPAADGTCEFRLHMKHGEGPFDVQGWWQRVEGGRYFLSTVSVCRKAPAAVATDHVRQRQPASTSAGRERR